MVLYTINKWKLKVYGNKIANCEGQFIVVSKNAHNYLYFINFFAIHELHWNTLLGLTSAFQSLFAYVCNGLGIKESGGGC